MFEGTSLYSLRLDHKLNNNHRLMLRANVSPSTVTGIEVNGQVQPFGQNAYSRTSEQTYRDAAGTVQHTWTIGNNKVNEFRSSTRGVGSRTSTTPKSPPDLILRSISQASRISDASRIPTFREPSSATS